MANQFFVAPSPHVHSAESTTKIMRDVVIALLPALVVSALLFGWSVLGVTALSVVCCVVFEYLIQRFMLRGAPTVGNLSAVVTGVLLAFSLPASCPYWVVAVGDAFAIIVVKGLIGGLGLLPSMNVGDDYAMFEAVHGSAPDIAGKHIANPTALLWSACMLLEHIGETAIAANIRKAVDAVLAEKKALTPDLGGTATTEAYRDAVIAHL